MRKYAEGYWQTREVEFDAATWELLRNQGIVVTQQFKGDVIAIVWGENEDQAAANARLVKASPDLLEALVDLRLAATSAGVAHNNPANIKARTAIAKTAED